MRKSISTILPVVVLGICLAAPGAKAQVQRRQQVDFGQNNLPSSSFFGNDNTFELDEEQAAQYQARDAEAEANFDAIMVPQNALKGGGYGGAPKAAPMPVRQKRRSYRRPEERWGATEDAPADASGFAPAPAGEEPEVELPLSEYAGLRKRLMEIRKRLARQMGPAVVLGAAEYSGDAIPGALHLTMKLQVTLGRFGKWKTVPLIGDDVVLVSTKVDGSPVPVSKRNGYHIWVTQRTGEVGVEVELLVPSRGPRGSIEFDFLVARTPVTGFECEFPVAGLEPRINAAVRSDFQPTAKGTLVTATLRPTTRIHLLGMKEMGDAEKQKAKIYVDSLNLLSVDEGTLELFAVFRYTILYAGTRSFNILLPPGMEVISAEGMGAFRYQKLDTDGGGTLLKGETAFPIRDKYEISLRLRRELTKKGEAFLAPLPRCQGVEQEIGYLGVEVPGKLQLEEIKEARVEVDKVTTPQLPGEMVLSAVSPILKAYRYHSPNAQVKLVATRLDEMKPKSASIDRVRAFTKVTQEGDVITDLRITLRNRLRPEVKLALPPGTEVSSALLDGQPFNPSQDDEGRILLPLKVSSGKESLRPFTVSVILESKIDPLGWFGMPDLALPAVDLPVSSLAWTVYLPARNLYSRLEGDIENQTFMGRAGWYQPAYQPQGDYGVAANAGLLGALQGTRPSATADAGAMPVRFKIPKEGLQLDYTRYWFNQDTQLQVGFGYVRSWLRYPAWLFLSLLGGLGLLLFSTRFGATPRRLLSWVGVVLAVGAAGTAVRTGSLEACFLGLLIGLMAVALHRSWFTGIPSRLMEWGSSLAERFRQRDRDPTRWQGRTLLLKILVTVGLCFFSLLLAEALVFMLDLLFYPLP